MQLDGDIIVHCPKTRVEVKVNQVCCGVHRCQYFKHLMVSGNKASVMCEWKA